MARHLYMLAALLSAAAALSGCQTVLLESHSDVSLGKPSFGRILVVASLPEKARRAAERELVLRLTGLEATPSYRLLSSEESTRRSNVGRRAAEDGFDALLEMRLIRSSFRTTPSLEDIPGNLIEDIAFGVTLTSLKDDRQLFSCVVRRRDSYTLPATVRGVARRALKQMKAEGLVD